MTRGENVLLSICNALAAASILAACAVVVTPLQPGTTTIEGKNQGLVFGRIALIRERTDLMALGPFRKEFGWELVQQESGKRFVVDPLTAGGWFVLSLPAGHYRVSSLTYNSEHSGVWSGYLPAIFEVQHGVINYIGTWEIEVQPLGSEAKASARVLNELEQAKQELTRSYTGVPKPIVVGLLKTNKEGSFGLLRPSDK